MRMHHESTDLFAPYNPFNSVSNDFGPILCGNIDHTGARILGQLRDGLLDKLGQCIAIGTVREQPVEGILDHGKCPRGLALRYATGREREYK